jgi:hypothetical protein
MLGTAKKLATNIAKYGEDADGTTHCSEFVRDWAAAVMGVTPPELNKKNSDSFAQANTQIEQLAHSDTWHEFPLSTDWDATYSSATGFANSGHIVLVGWENPSSDLNGHIAAVMPLPRKPGYKGIATINGGHGYDVPIIAEASIIDADCTTTGVDWNVRLSCGFSSKKQPNLRFFVYKHNTSNS